MRLTVIAILIAAISSVVFSQERQQDQPAVTETQATESQSRGPESTGQQKPVTTSPGDKIQPTQPATNGNTTATPSHLPTKKQVPSAHKPWYANRNVWTFVEIGGVAAAGGYLVSDGGTGRRIGGGVMIGVSGYALCAIFVRGCTR